MISDNDIVSMTTVLVLFALLAAATATDYKTHRIPNWLLIPALGLALRLHMMDSGIYRVGDVVADGLVLEEIEPDAAILDYLGQKIRIRP